MRDAFAHRRKSLARSLEHARRGRGTGARGARGSGCPRTRARSNWRRGSSWRWPRSSGGAGRDPAGPGEAQPVPVPGPTRADGLHELRRFLPAAAHRPDRRRRVRRAGRRGDLHGMDGPNLVGVALRQCGRGDGGAAVRVAIEKRIPVAAGLGGGSADAAAVLRLAKGELGELRGGRRGARRRCAVPAGSEVRAGLGGGRGGRAPAVSGRVRPRADPRRRGVCRRPIPTGRRIRSGSGAARRNSSGCGERLREVAGAGGSPLDYAELLTNDLEQAAASLRPGIAEALAVLRHRGGRRAHHGRRLRADRGRPVRGTSWPPTRPPTAVPPRYANAIVSAPQRLRYSNA